MPNVAANRSQSVTIDNVQIQTLFYRTPKWMPLHTASTVSHKEVQSADSDQSFSTIPHVA